MNVQRLMSFCALEKFDNSVKYLIITYYYPSIHIFSNLILTGVAGVLVHPTKNNKKAITLGQRTQGADVLSQQTHIDWCSESSHSLISVRQPD